MTGHFGGWCGLEITLRLTIWTRCGWRMRRRRYTRRRMTITGFCQAGQLVMETPTARNVRAAFREGRAVQPPTDRFYGVEALFKDNSGNWFSLTQPKENFV
jgi:hypothetical protein